MTSRAYAKIRDEGPRNTKGKAIADALKAIYKESRDENLLPERVLEHASNPTSKHYPVLHDQFDWNDASAGHKYRLTQARWMIAVVLVDEPRAEAIRYFIRLSSESGYRSIDNIMKSESLVTVMLHDAKQEYERFKRKFQNISAFVELWRVGDMIFADIGSVSKKKKPSGKKGKRK